MIIYDEVLAAAGRTQTAIREFEIEFTDTNVGILFVDLPKRNSYCEI